ncbi:hypothetical protein LTR95_003516 [Oleoguttula sp. CCFEE 5521]
MSARMIVVAFLSFLLDLAAAMDVPNQSTWQNSFFEDAFSSAEDTIGFVAEAAIQAGVARARVLDSLTPPAAERYVQQQRLDIQHHQLPNDVAEPAEPLPYPPPTPPEPPAYYIMPADLLPAPVSDILGWMWNTFTPMVQTVAAPAELRPQRPHHPTHRPSTTATSRHTRSSFAILAPAPQTRHTPNTSVSSHPHHCRHPGCDQSRATRASLKKHQKSHIPVANRKHGCPAETCSKRFNDKKDLDKHEFTHDADHTVRFACPHQDCKAHIDSIVRRDNFLRHMKVIHGTILPRRRRGRIAGGS